MSSYRVARRAFLAAAGGAFGLRTLLDNLQASAEGVSSPPRFLLAHFPMGTLRYRFLVDDPGADYTPSEIIMPFIDADLRDDMTVFFGLSDQHLTCPSGGSHEAGTPFTTTCCSAEGTRSNGGEFDDAVAGGPSFDQVFLETVPGLRRPGQGYANAICDARVQSNEISTRCLSYSSETRSIASSVPGGDIAEYVPLLPELSPARLYAELFSSFMPGGNTAANSEAALMALKMRRSALDFSVDQLAKLKTIVPGSESPKIELHTEAIRKAEEQLVEQIDVAAAVDGTGCTPPEPPLEDLVGGMGNASRTLSEEQDDTALHRQIALAHAAVLRAAFQCDLLRVGTLQFVPGNSQVAFAGMWPSDPERIAGHHAVSQTTPLISGGASAPPPTSGDALDAYQFMVNAQVWYNSLMAEILRGFKDATDAFGNSLLAHTVIPFVTEVAEASHTRAPKPAFLFGGGGLGMQHGTFQYFQSLRFQVDLYLTAAQALFQTSDIATSLAGQRFWQFNPGADVIPGLWQ